MHVGERIRAARQAKGFSQKEIALALQMDQSQYSKIEQGKTDPTTTTLEKVATALGLAVGALFATEPGGKSLESFDKTLLEKLQLLEELEESERRSLYHIIDSLLAKKRLKAALSQAMEQAA